MKRFQIVAVIAVAVGLVGCGGGGITQPVASPEPAKSVSITVRGGSNYNWVNTLDCFNADYVCSEGSAKVFNAPASTVQAQMQQLFANGQRQLGVQFFYGYYPYEALTQYAEMAKAVGFQGLTVELGRVDFDPSSATQYDDYLAYVIAVHDALKVTSLPFYIDLSGEMPNWCGATCLSFMSRLWKDYTARYGGANTVGFSFNTVPMLSLVKQAYGSTMPACLDIHVYGASAVDTLDAIRSGGLGCVIIGETYYNDAQDAQELDSYHDVIKFVLQWSLARNGPVNTFDSVMPFQYRIWAAVGF